MVKISTQVQSTLISHNIYTTAKLQIRIRKVTEAEENK